MKQNNERVIKRGEIYYYDFGEIPGSIQNGIRPVIVLQTDIFNEHSPTVIVAAITSVLKKSKLSSHIIIGENYGLEKPSMILLEQIRTINQSDLSDYVGCIDDEKIWKKINNGLKKTIGVWFYENKRKAEIMSLCSDCLKKFQSLPGVTVLRTEPFQKKNIVCSCCNKKQGYDYVIFDKRKVN